MAPLRFSSAVAELALPDAELLAGELAISRVDDPFEQWLRWEERANLVGFRTSTEPVALEVSAIPADRVLVQQAADVPSSVLRRFFRRGPRAVPEAPAEPRQEGRVLACARRRALARALHVVAHTGRRRPSPAKPAFSVKLPTDHPHPDFEQPEKTQLREEAEDAIRLAALIRRVDSVLGADPALRLVSEAITVLVPGTEYGFVVRDLRPLQDGSFYLPALSIPWVGRQIARLHGEPLR